jgi:hypothetical protein
MKSITLGTGLTRLELATSAVTGRCSNQLNYNPSSLYIAKLYKYVNLLATEKQGFEPWIQIFVR